MTARLPFWPCWLLLMLLAPAAALADRGLDLEIGKALFERLWVEAPASTRAADGLGPLYNARSCAACHPAAGRGRPPAGDDPEDQGIGFAIRLGNDPVYGRQVQIHGVTGHTAEGRVAVAWHDEKVAFPDGHVVVLRRPAFTVTDLGFGPITAATSPRVAPPVRGMGVLEAIPEAAILALADPDDRDGDGVSGRAARVPAPGGGMALGRFGRKASHATLESQDADAFGLDIGMSTPLHRDPWGDCTPTQTACRAAPHGDQPQFGGLEIPGDVLALVDGYLRALPPPGDRKPEGEGAALFAATGCAACHTQRFDTGNGPVHPYSDLLLHDLGPDLADGLDEAGGTGAEWRTAPLWGLNRLAAEEGRLALLHDGRARSVEEAILWHGGEAARARERYRGLSRADRDRLLRFVRSL